jgi:hypothetical protein
MDINQKMQNIIDTKHQFQLSNLSRVAAASRRGVPDWRIDNTFEGMIQDCLALEARSGSNASSLLGTLRQGLIAQEAPAKDDTLDKISKSLHAIHKRQDASDQFLADLADKISKL